MRLPCWRSASALGWRGRRGDIVVMVFMPHIAPGVKRFLPVRDRAIAVRRILEPSSCCARMHTPARTPRDPDTLRHNCRDTRGVIAVTLQRRVCSSRWPIGMAQPAHEARQRGQRRDVQARTAGGDHDEGILRPHARPACGKRDQPPLVIGHADANVAPRVPLGDEIEFSPKQGMKRVRDPHPPRRITGTGCTRWVDRTPGA